MSLAELRPHLHTLPDLPDWIPDRTSYYAETWGFCLSQRALDALPEDDYEVSIDSTLAPGHLSYGELVLPGEDPAEVVFSTHVAIRRWPTTTCRRSPSPPRSPGISRRGRHRYTYRFIFAPGTIGTIAWLARNRDVVPRIRAGLTLTCLGDGSPFTYKRTVGGTAEIDRAAALALRDAGPTTARSTSTRSATTNASTTRPVPRPGWLADAGPPRPVPRVPHVGRQPRVHLRREPPESLATVQAIVDVLEGNRTYTNLAPDGEPQLGKRGLYGAIGGTDIPDLNLAMLWVLTCPTASTT